MTTKAAITTFLAHPALALVGASRSGNKFGNLALRELRSKGYRVYPVHPTAASIEGAPCVPSFEDLPERVDAALISIPPAQAVKVVHQAADAGIHHVWLQQGAESPEVLDACRDRGVDAIAGECVLMFADPRSYHRLHRAIWGLLGKLPA